MRLLLILTVFVGLGLNIAQGQVGADSLSMQATLDSLVDIQNVNDLEILDLQVYLRPCDTLGSCQNQDSMLYNYLGSATGAAHADIIVQVKNASLVHRLHLKAGRTTGAAHFIQQQTPFRTIANPPQGVTITLAAPNVLVIKIDRCLQAVPFYLEAWLEDDDGNLSVVKTFTIQL